MPKRTDIETILVIGAGPIIIGQAAEFDYSGTQAVKALKAEGFRIVLVNSNPATIMTDPEFADATYIEPITPEIIAQIIKKEKPDAVLPTVGGQTALNAALALEKQGILEQYGVELLGAKAGSIDLAEDRLKFKEAMEANGLAVPRGQMVGSIKEAWKVAEEIGRFPILLRPSFTLGGHGGGIAYSPNEFEEKVAFALQESPVHTVLVEESVLGWKEYELEVMRDRANNFVVICSIENIDPMGIHTGDSITVAPAMTLTDREYQRLRDQARAIMDIVGVETGGSNVQFAVNPDDGRVLVIEMNPRVSRSSALASKATGFPIAKIAAMLAVGYTLDEIKNDITQTTVASFEPSIDYVVTKLPRWAFEKFRNVDNTLNSQMKSVGEAMAIGRTFKESFLKGLTSLELSRSPFPRAENRVWDGEVASLGHPTDKRMWAVWEALQAGVSVDAVHQATRIDPWFLAQFTQIAATEREIAACESVDSIAPNLLHRAKRAGFGDAHIAYLVALDTFPAPADSEEPDFDKNEVRERRKALGIESTYHVVDTCAAEFESFTPYMYSSYESESEAPPTDREKVIILGNGPNRIGQGIEFDYCCVHAAFALRDAGYEAIMVNCNPETVSTDYDTSDRLYFEPLDIEHVLTICEREQPRGVIVQFGGQTPLKLSADLKAAGVPILGTSPDSIDIAEDRERFVTIAKELGIPVPEHGMAHGIEDARATAEAIGYPVIVRPSYVLGGRAMAIIYGEEDLVEYVTNAFEANPGNAILIDEYLEDTYEVDVDAVSDGERVVIGGVMQHIEEAGVHSGDSACVIPPYKISLFHLSHIRDYTEALAHALAVVGLMNVQFAIKDDVVYVLEVNPRASRTIPYVSKATGVPMAKVATRALMGESLRSQGLIEEPRVYGFFVKEAVLPFRKFLGVDARLGPEMRSTGEVMGHASRFGEAFAKAQLAAGDELPLEGAVFISVNDYDKSAALKVAKDLHGMGFNIMATRGTADFFERTGLPVTYVPKINENADYNIVTLMRDGKVDLIINTPLGRTAHTAGMVLRTNAVRYGIPMTTTLSAAQAAVLGIRRLRQKGVSVRSLQAHYRVTAEE